MSDIKSEYISCMKLHGVPLLPPVLTQKSRKEMEYYKMLAISAERRIAVLKSSKHLNDICTFVATSDTGKESPNELIENQSAFQHVDNSIYNKHTNETAETLESENISTTCNELEEFFNDNPENNTEFASMVSDITVIDVSSANLEKSANTTSNPVVENYTISKDNVTVSHKEDYLADMYPVEQTTVAKAIIDEEKVDKNIPNGDYVDGKPTRETFFKDIEKIQSDGNGTQSPDSISITNYSKKRLDNSKKFTGSLNDISSSYFGSPKLYRQKSYTIEHPSPVLLAHLEVQSINSGMEVSSISMSESFATLPRLQKKRSSWNLEMAKVKWTSMMSDLNKPQHTKGITAEKHSGSRVDSYQKQIRYSPKKGVSKTPSPGRIQQLSRPNTYLQNDKKSNVKILPKSSTLVLNQIPLRRTPSIQKKSLATQNIISKVTEGTTVTTQQDMPATIQEMIEKIQSQQVMQMAALLEKQKLEQLILQKSFEEQKNIFMRQLKQICPNNLDQSKRSKDNNLNAYKNCENKADQFMLRCEEVLNEGRMVLRDVKMAVDSSNIPESINNSAPINLQTIFDRPKSIDCNSNQNIKVDCVDSEIMTDRTNDTLADLNFTLSSDPAEDSCRFEIIHNNSDSILDANTTFILKNGGESGLELNTTFLKSQQNARLHSNDSSMNKQLNYTKKTVRKLFQEHPTLQERAAATRIVAWCKGYLVRRLLRTARVQATVQTIRDALCCALQLHCDREGIRGADIDLHRRLIQQITAACYSLHDTFVGSSAAERCELIAQDRQHRRLVSARQQTPPYERPLSGPKRVNKNQIDRMSQSHLGVFPSQTGWNSAHSSDLMTRSNYGTLSIDDKHHGSTSRKCISGKEVHSRKPWR